MLATCEERGLEYVTDETNFQPEVTLRNAIRHVLDGGKSADVSVLDAASDICPVLTGTRISVTITRCRKRP